MFYVIHVSRQVEQIRRCHVVDGVDRRRASNSFSSDIIDLNMVFRDISVDLPSWLFMLICSSRGSPYEHVRHMNTFASDMCYVISYGIRMTCDILCHTVCV